MKKEFTYITIKIENILTGNIYKDLFSYHFDIINTKDILSYNIPHRWFPLYEIKKLKKIDHEIFNNINKIIKTERSQYPINDMDLINFSENNELNIDVIEEKKKEDENINKDEYENVQITEKNKIEFKDFKFNVREFEVETKVEEKLHSIIENKNILDMERSEEFDFTLSKNVQIQYQQEIEYAKPENKKK